MSFDPNTAVVVYQPTDWYAFAAKGVSESLDAGRDILELMAKDLSLLAPKAEGFFPGIGRITVLSSGQGGTADEVSANATADKIRRIEGTRSFIEGLEEGFTRTVKGFESTFPVEITSMKDAFMDLQVTCMQHLRQYSILLEQQKKAESLRSFMSPLVERDAAMTVALHNPELAFSPNVRGFSAFENVRVYYTAPLTQKKTETLDGPSKGIGQDQEEFHDLYSE